MIDLATFSEANNIHIYTRKYKWAVTERYYKFTLQFEDSSVWNPEIEEFSDDVTYSTHIKAVEAAIKYYLEGKHLLQKHKQQQYDQEINK